MQTGESTRADNINGYLKGLGTALSGLPIDVIQQVVDVIATARDKGKRIFIFGNGGSAATASHFACDLSKGAMCQGVPRIKAFSLTDGMSLVSAWANDSAYEDIFSQQVENHVEAGDVVIAISGSGNSRNILKGVEVAGSKGATTIGFTAFDGGKLKAIVDIPIVAPVHNMEQAEDLQLVLEHIVTMCLRKAAQTPH